MVIFQLCNDCKVFWSYHNLPIKSGPAAVNISSRGVVGYDLNCTKSGNSVWPGQFSTVGVPNAWNILANWSKSVSPAIKGILRSNSARIHPTAQTSTPVP